MSLPYSTIVLALTYYPRAVPRSALAAWTDQLGAITVFADESDVYSDDATPATQRCPESPRVIERPIQVMVRA